MCYTDNRRGLCGRDTLQICSIKVASIRGGLRWPLDMFGVVTVRDVLEDRDRNIVFARARNNYQTITEEVIIFLCSHPIIAFSIHGRPMHPDETLSVCLLNYLLLHTASVSKADGSFPCCRDMLRSWEH
jgi:hypothetical protein